MGVALKTAPRSTAISPAKCAGGCRLRSLTRNACDTGRFARGCRGIGGKKISLGASVEAFSFVPMQGHVQDDLTFATQPALLRVGPFRRLDSLYLFGLRCFRRPPTEVVLSALHRAGFTSAQSTGERNSCGKTCTDRPASTGTCMHPKGVIPQFRRRNRTF